MQASFRRLLRLTIDGDKLRQGFGHLDPRESILALTVPDEHRKIETAIGNMREWPPRIERERSENRKNRVSEVGVRDRALLVVQFGVIENVHTRIG